MKRLVFHLQVLEKYYPGCKDLGCSWRPLKYFKHFCIRIFKQLNTLMKSVSSFKTGNTLSWIFTMSSKDTKPQQHTHTSIRPTYQLILKWEAASLASRTGLMNFSALCLLWNRQALFQETKSSPYTFMRGQDPVSWMLLNSEAKLLSEIAEPQYLERMGGWEVRVEISCLFHARTLRTLNAITSPCPL